MIYLASPYSHPDPAVREERWRQALLATKRLMESGTLVFSPILSNHYLAVAGLSGGWDFWKRFDEYIVRRCESLWVLCLDGWRESVGVREEIEIACDAGLWVRFLDPDTLKDMGDVQCRS